MAAVCVDDLAQCDRPTVSELPGPVAELVPPVVRGVRVAPREQGVPGEDACGVVRRENVAAEPERLGQVRRPRHDPWIGGSDGVDPAEGGPRHLPGAGPGLGVRGELGGEPVVELEGGQGRTVRSPAVGCRRLRCVVHYPQR